MKKTVEFIAECDGQEVIVNLRNCHLNAESILMAEVQNTDNRQGNINPRWVNTKNIQCSAKQRVVMKKIFKAKLIEKRKQERNNKPCTHRPHKAAHHVAA